MGQSRNLNLRQQMKNHNLIAKNTVVILEVFPLINIGFRFRILNF